MLLFNVLFWSILTAWGSEFSDGMFLPSFAGVMVLANLAAYFWTEEDSPEDDLDGEGLR